MSLLSSLKELLNTLCCTDRSIKSGFKFSQKEISEIMSISKKGNLKYFETLAKIPDLKYFDIAYLLSKVDLTDEKIELIKEARKIYNDEEFRANGQTESDFVFRVAANIEYLTKENIGVFKELAKCKNELYDFKDALKNPVDMLQNQRKEVNFAFVTVYCK